MIPGRRFPILKRRNGNSACHQLIPSTYSDANTEIMADPGLFDNLYQLFQGILFRQKSASALCNDHNIIETKTKAVEIIRSLTRIIPKSLCKHADHLEHLPATELTRKLA
jgi:hypothetical protein